MAVPFVGCLPNISDERESAMVSALAAATWRWRANRIQNPDVLAQVAGANAQSLVNFFAIAGQAKAVEDDSGADFVIREVR